MRLRLGERGRAAPTSAVATPDGSAAEPAIDGAATAAHSGQVGDRWLRILVFVAGICSLSLEVCTPRLIGPYFGTSLLVWANVIGFFLLYLALGYWLGGRVADRYPSPRLLCALTYAAALWTGLLPWISRPVLDWSVGAFDSVDAVAFYGSMVAVLLLFAVPITLLGFVAPFAIRLSVRRLGSAGRSSGSLYALSTAGSILGAFLPVLVLIPDLGVRRTLLVTSVALVGASLWGLDVPLWLPGALSARIGARVRARWAAAVPGVILLVPLLLPNVAPLGPLKQVRGLIYYQESLYNYIQVVKEPDGTIELVLNEGHAIHSVYNPNQILTGWYWDYFLSAPYFNAGFQPQQVKRVAVIGLAAGTIARQFTAVYPGVQIDGVEIDPAIVDVGRRYFDMTEPNLHVYVADGRTFMRKTQQTYDVVAIDAFQQPYIPFQLTTREFFEEIRAHLSPHGVVSLNTGHTKTDRRLVQAFVNTLSQVFPSVYTFDVPGTFNTEVMATLQPTSLATYQTQLSNVSGDPIMEQVASEAGPVATVGRPERGGIVFSDDQAPIEQITDQLLLSYIQQGR
jgi:spermidine synthase